FPRMHKYFSAWRKEKGIDLYLFLVYRYVCKQFVPESIGIVMFSSLIIIPFPPVFKAKLMIQLCPPQFWHNEEPLVPDSGLIDYLFKVAVFWIRGIIENQSGTNHCFNI